MDGIKKRSTVWFVALVLLFDCFLVISSSSICTSVNNNNELAITANGLQENSTEYEIDPNINKYPDHYPPENVYYLTFKGLECLRDLRGTQKVSDGSKTDIDKLFLMNGCTYSFIYPPLNQKQAKFIRNPEFKGGPYISLVVNTLDRPGKIFTARLGLDTNNKYDPKVPNSLEHYCEFSPFETVIDKTKTPLEEEYYNECSDTGWYGGSPPTVVYGRLILEVTMTSPNGEPGLLYCGFNYKSSWLACEYMHNDLFPKAKIKEKYCLQGYNPKPKLLAGESVYFDGSDSYDPTDDLNGNNQIDTYEIDRLKYKWSWGDGTETKFEYSNKVASHAYSVKDIPIKSEFGDFYVNLTVMNSKQKLSSNYTWIRIYRGNHSPLVDEIRVNNIKVYPNAEREITSVLSDRVKLYFQTKAHDIDEDELVFNWDFDGNLSTFEYTGLGEVGEQCQYTFTEPEYSEGEQLLTLVVSDGTKSLDTYATFIITLKKNTEPIAKILARCEDEGRFYKNNITVELSKNIIFYANNSFDPDQLIGFDFNNDSTPDEPLRYRWNFNSYNPLESTEWTFDTYYIYAYYYPGRYQYWVTLDVDDGVNVTTSQPFLVKINIRPIAKILIDPLSYDSQGKILFEFPIYLNGSYSYDPNGDGLIEYVWKITMGDEVKIKYGKVIEYLFNRSGKTQIALQVFDGRLWSDPDTISIDIKGPSEIYGIRYTAFPIEIYTNEFVFFNVEILSEPGFNNDINIIWDFGDGIELKMTCGRFTSHEYKLPGWYKTSILVQDKFGRNFTKSDVIITVKNRLPVAVIEPINKPHAGWNVVVSAENSHDPDGKIVEYIWSFGDEKGDVITEGPRTEHVWDKPGTYTVHLTVLDEHGGTADTSLTLTIKGDENEPVDNGFTTIIIVIVLFNIITIPTLIKLIALLHARKKGRMGDSR